MQKRLEGILRCWSCSSSGGWGFIEVGPMTFFLHNSGILSGLPLAGSKVTFTPLPPTQEHRKHARATEAILESPPSANSVRRPAPRQSRHVPSALTTEPREPRPAPKTLDADTAKARDVLAGGVD